MKKFILLLIIVPFLASCGAGGGAGTAGGAGSSGDTNIGYKPICSSISNAAKIRINEDGIYRVTFTDLINACVDLSGTDTSRLKMINQGNEIAIDVADNNHNGIFDDGDYLEFYGIAIPRGDSRFRFTATNVYFLSAGSTEGNRIKPANSSTSQLLNTPVSFRKTLHMEQDSWYEQKNYPEVKSSGDVREHWFWGEVFYTPGISGTNTGYYKRDYNFSTRYLDKTQLAALKIRLQSVNGSHHVRVYINPSVNSGPVADVNDMMWNNDSSYDVVLTFPSSLLNDGPNVLRIESVGDTSSGNFELFYLDWFELAYYHLYKAEHDEIEFSGDGSGEITNFYTPDVSMYDISDLLNVRKVIPMSIDTTATGVYKLRFSVVNPGGQSQEMKFLALSASNKKTPFSLEAYIASDLKSKNADYVIITHENFYDAITPLADYRQKHDGYNILTVRIKDIYDEFSYGIETPQAIKDFLAYAYNNWATRPRFVLLVGDATVDYKDISGYGSYGVKSYIPAYLYNYPGLGEVPADNWFVDVNNDVIPDMNIGRIPAKSPEDVAAVIGKIISHEGASGSGNALLVADVEKDSQLNVAPPDEQIFEKLSDSLAGIIPDATKIYRRIDPDNFKANVIAGINSGPLIVNYTGHGSVVDWTSDAVFSSQDVAGLTNKAYPFVVALNCLNGYFILPDDGVTGADGTKQYPSIAEAFLLAQDKGAVAVFASGALGYPTEHDPLAKSLYGTLFSQNVTLGEAVTEAKTATYTNQEISEDVVYTFNFFGDPATKLR